MFLDDGIDGKTSGVYEVVRSAAIVRLAIYGSSRQVKREVCMVEWLGEYENKGTRDDIYYETPKWVNC